jgi:hypothetical protein
VNGSELGEHYDDRLSGDASGKGRDPAKPVPSYHLPPSYPDHKQGYRAPNVDTRQDPYNPYSKFLNRDTPYEDDRVSVAVSRERMS